LVLREDVGFDGSSFASWLNGQPDLSTKWQPRFVRVSEALPSTPTNKVLTRTLVHQKYRSDRVGGDAVYLRARGEESYRRFDERDEARLREAFAANGRLAVWDL
jgi:fatty-acyl-CoA synthase